MEKNTIAVKVDAEKLINEVFEKIKQYKTSDELKKYRLNEIEKEIGISFNEEKYPPIMFQISSEEILLIKEIITNSENIKNPLAKILYAMAWKQGDLPKLEHIINGVLNSCEKQTSQDNALVFYQFGKHLANPEMEPIVDQHVLRAFSAYYYKNENLEKTKEKKQIDDYKQWLKSDELNDELKADKKYLYEIDKLLFVIGKAIKQSK